MEKLQPLREKIDELDNKILHSLKERMEVCRAVGVIKRQHGITVRDSTRENEVYKRINEKATRLGLNGSQAEKVYREIIAMCISAQESDAET
jgi:chorismate mutase